MPVSKSSKGLLPERLTLTGVCNKRGRGPHLVEILVQAEQACNMFLPASRTFKKLKVTHLTTVDLLIAFKLCKENVQNTLLPVGRRCKALLLKMLTLIGVHNGRAGGNDIHDFFVQSMFAKRIFNICTYIDIKLVRLPIPRNKYTLLLSLFISLCLI